MGCQNSRLVNTDILAIPPKLRPLLWRKVEEFRRRRGGGAAAGPTLSGEELLKETEPFARENERESMSSLGSQPKSAQQENVGVSEEIKEVERTESNEDDKQEKEEKEEKEEKGDISNEEEEEEDCDEERNICPGSPSFRVYIESSTDKEKKLEDHESDDKTQDENENVDENMQKKCSRESSVDSVIVLEEDQDPIEEQEMKIATKKGKNRMRITRAICRGPVVMKNLLHVTSCYHPSNERASLLAKKIDP